MSLLRVAYFLCFLKLTDCSLLFQSTSESLEVSTAVIKTFFEVCVTCNSEIFVTISTNDVSTINLASNVISNFKNPVQIETKINVLKDRRRIYVLLFVDNFDGFMKFYVQMSVDKFYFNGFYVILFPNGDFRDMNKIFDFLWKLFVFNVVLISRELKMFTFMPFGTLGKCSDVTPRKINEFDGSSMQWTTNVFFPKKFTNLNKCHIKCGTFNLIPAIIVGNHSDGSVALSGFDVDTFNILLQSINAVVEYTIYPVDTGTIYQNGTATGLLGHTIRGE